VGIIPKLAEVRFQTDSMRRHPLQFIGQHVQLGMNVRESLVDIFMLVSQLVATSFVMLLGLTHGVQVFRCARDVDVEFMVLMGAGELVSQMESLFRGAGDVDPFAIRVEEVPDAFPCASSVMVA
jgi:hypothetical protein